MAAPLPSGLNVSVVPQAPQVDPRMFAGDPQGALASMQAGLLLSQELASLENKKAQRALEAEKIKLDMQRNKLERLQAEETMKQLQDPNVLRSIVEAGVRDRQLTAAQKAHATALGSAYGAAGLPMPTGALAGETVFQAPGSMAPAAPASLAGQTVSAAAPGTSPLAGSPLFNLGLAKRAAEKEVEIREQAAANEQTALNAQIRPLESVGAIDRRGLYRPGTELLDPVKVNEAMSALRKIPEYAPIFRDLDKTAPAFDAQQKSLREALTPFVNASLVRLTDLQDEKGFLRPGETQKKLVELAEKYPVQAKLVDSNQLVALGRVRTAVSALEKAEEALGKLGDPTFFQSVLNFMPNPEEAKGTWKTFRDTAAARGLDPETVARNTLVQVLNSQVQTAFAGAGQSGGVGLAAKRMAPFEASYTNDQLKAAIKQAIPVAKEHYEDILGSTGNPDVVRKYVERDGRTVREASTELVRAVDITPAPVGTERMMRHPKTGQMEPWVSVERADGVLIWRPKRKMTP